MIVRRTISERIRLVHKKTGHTFEIRVLGVGSNNDGRHRALVEMIHQADFSARARHFDLCHDTGNLYLWRDGEVHLRHSSGEAMKIRIYKIQSFDVHFRLEDEDKNFEFLWSDDRLKT